MDVGHAAEFRRCLIEADVVGIMAIWKHVAPHLADTSPADALCSLHIARVDAKTIPRKLKTYSAAWLAERGIQKIEGRWVTGLEKTNPVAESVGIASKSADPAFAKKIVRGMEDALLNGLEKGIVEPPMQRELMLAARAKIRFRARV